MAAEQGDAGHDEFGNDENELHYADHADHAAIQLEVQGLLDARIEKSSRYNYSRSNIRFIIWLFNHKRELLTDVFLGGIANLEEGPTEAYIKGILAPPVRPEMLPVRLENFNVKDFMEYIVTLKKANGKAPGA